MRLGAILFTLGYGGCMIALLMLIPFGFSLFEEGLHNVGNFSIGLMLTAFVSGALLLTGYNSRRHHARGIELLLIMVLFWAVLPAMAALPLIGATQIHTLLAAYFEAVSALTTSGGTVLTVPQVEAPSILIWRSLLSWLGGLWTLVFAVAVLAPFGIGGLTLIGSPLLQHEEGAPLSSRLGRPLRLILPVYLLFTVLGVIALLAFGSPALEAFCLAMTSISTSGMTLRDGSLFTYTGFGQQGVISLLCLIGSISVPILVMVTLGRRARGNFPVTEMRAFFIIIFAYMVVTLMTQPQMHPATALFQSVSLHSTAGFNFIAGQGMAQWPTVWVMLPVLVGGMALSTTGGIKVMRVIILIKDIGSELGKLIYPSSIQPLSLEGRRLEQSDFSAAWAYMAVFILFISLGVLLLGLFGMNLEAAWPIVLGALTNSLAITGHIGTPSLYAAMSDPLQITVTLLMIAGRIELLVLMVLFTSSFWRYMR